VTEAAETDAVAAFIREQQGTVLADAIGQLSACSDADLRAVVHAISGSVGSYQLDQAFACVATLSAVLHDESASPTDIAAARATTLASLRALEGDPR
jgi:hypothetical protein